MEPPRNQWNEFDELTLSVMANRNRYDKYVKIKSINSNVEIDLFSKEKTYYKERIMAMTRDLFDERCENNNINEAHQEYLKACIEYLKWNDITELVEQDNRRERRVDENTAVHDENTAVHDGVVLISARNEIQRKIDETPVVPVDVTSDNENDEGEDESDDQTTPRPPPFQDRIVSFANKMCIRKKSMDDFIVMKPVSADREKEITDRLPKIRDYHNEIMKRAEKK